MHAGEHSSEDASIVEFSRWLRTPPGRYLLGWEQAQMDAAVNDVFGFHAVQLGLPELQGLRANRMPHRWLALDHPNTDLAGMALASPDLAAPACAFEDSLSGPSSVLALDGVAMHCDFHALPLDTASLDLLVLPHALEQAADPHQTLREVERVLRPEGRVVITGLNPASLWGLRQNLGHTRDRLGRSGRHLFLPRGGEFIGYWRLRDWLRLLNLEVEQARFGCYRPPWRTEAWLQRWAWTESVGQRWWTVLGAVYFIVAVKRVHGMRLVGLAKQHKRAASAAPVVAMRPHHRQQHQENP